MNLETLKALELEKLERYDQRLVNLQEQRLQILAEKSASLNRLKVLCEYLGVVCKDVENYSSVSRTRKSSLINTVLVFFQENPEEEYTINDIQTILNNKGITSLAKSGFHTILYNTLYRLHKGGLIEKNTAGFENMYKFRKG